MQQRKQKNVCPHALRPPAQIANLRLDPRLPTINIRFFDLTEFPPIWPGAAAVWVGVPIDVETGAQALPALSRQARGGDCAKESNAMTNATTVSLRTPVPSLHALKLAHVCNTLKANVDFIKLIRKLPSCAPAWRRALR
jgi:hypothetical protein